MMNKKGQYYQPQPQPYSTLSPVLIVGIAVVLLHFILRAVQINSPWFVFNLGLVLCLLGGLMSIYIKD